MDAKRATAAAVIALTGAALLWVNGLRLLAAGSTLATAAAALGAVVSLALIAAGVWVHTAFDGDNAVRIAGWNLLGVVVLGAVLALVLSSGRVEDPALVAANVVAVGAVAHVLIGVYDARRIRAEELARERRRIAVLNRVLRHNLRNEAQALTVAADRIAEIGEGPEAEQVGGIVAQTAARVTSINEKAGEINAILGEDSAGDPVAVGDLLGSVADRAAERFPAVRVAVEVEGVRDDRVDDRLEAALWYLVENAAEHGAGAEPHRRGAPVAADGEGAVPGDPEAGAGGADAGADGRDPAADDRPVVRVSAGGDGAGDGGVRFVVADDGPGIPDEEWGVVAGDRAVTQLEHGSGLGLPAAKWIVEACGGTLDRETGAEGARLVVTVPRARN